MSSKTSSGSVLIVVAYVSLSSEPHKVSTLRSHYDGKEGRTLRTNVLCFLAIAMILKNLSDLRGGT
jgi:hypothetical protein